MSNTLDFIEFKTLPKDYSWDLGTPGVLFTDYITNEDELKVINSQTGNVQEYIGYAPYFTVSLSSEVLRVPASFLATERTIDFGDYYNSETNILTNSTLSSIAFCHTYIMPGIYTIRYKVKDYVEQQIATDYQPLPCVETYADGSDCFEWSWKNLNCTFNPTLSVTWSLTLPGSAYRKFWQFEPCPIPGFFGGLYTESLEQNERAPLSWQWYNFLCQSSNNPNNFSIRWGETGFQGLNQIIWSQATPCITIQDLEPSYVSWKWDDIKCDDLSNVFSPSVKTWDDLSCSLLTGRSWTNLRLKCFERFTQIKVISAIPTTDITKEAIIRVLEIPPKAFLDIEQPENYNDRVSPITVRLSPKFIKCGSFPIEKIVWDLGDGSPLLEQKRWAINSDFPFVFNREFLLDSLDPRNYDVVHTYTKTPDSNYVFYPSLTAYASSTQTSDQVSGLVGPLKLPPVNNLRIDLLQNELVDDRKVYLAEINNNLVLFNNKFEETLPLQKTVKFQRVVPEPTEPPEPTLEELTDCLETTPYLIFQYDSNEEPPSEGFKRLKACYRCLIIQLEKGNIINIQIPDSTTTNNLDMLAILQENSLIPENKTGEYIFRFEFFGWKNKNLAKWISSDTKFNVYSSCLTNWNDNGVWYDSEIWSDCA